MTNLSKQQELEAQVDRYRRALEGAGAGLWDWDMVHNRVFLSTTWKNMLGYQDHEVQNTFSSWKNLWHPDDAPKIQQAMDKYLAGQSKVYEIEYRLKHKDGSWHWIRTRGELEKDRSGNPIRWTGTNIDITKQKHLELKLTGQTALFKKIFDAFPGFIGVKDRHGRFIMVNQALSTQWGFDSDEMIGKTDIELLGDIPEARQYMKDDQEVLSFSQEKVILSEPVPTHDGKNSWFTTLKLPFMIPGSDEQALLFVAMDISKQKKLELNLYKQTDQLKEHNQEIEAINHKLLESMKEAQKANKAKSDFLATMSHELRTPLNGILGFSQILLETCLEQSQRELIEIIIQSGNNLLGIISDILNFSAIDAQKICLKPEKKNIRKLVEQALQHFNHHASKKGVQLLLKMEEPFPKLVEIDPLRFNQVLLNLLSNAVKFTDHGQISVTIKKRWIDAEHQRVNLQLSVQDTGIGIKKEHQKMIFEPFSQVDMSNTREHEGIGLGLAITKQLLNKMGSELRLTSTYGKGSDFSFDLILPYYESIPSGQNHTMMLPWDEEAFKKILSGKTILISEDDPINRKLTRTVLSKFSPDLTLLEAKNGRDAFRLYRKHHPDLIFMDIIMPEVDGYQATAMIRTYNEQVPIIAMTAKAFREDKEACLASGMNDFITKPITLNQLKQALEKHLCEGIT